MTTELFKPQNKTLQKYIECIYILKHSKNETKTRFISFPTIYTIAVITKDAESKILSNEIIIKNSSTNPFLSDFDLFQEPVWVNYEGEIKEVCIYFKPLGINHFLDKDFNFYCKQVSLPLCHLMIMRTL